MVCHPRLPSPTWRTFMRHHVYDLIASGADADLAHCLYTSSVKVMSALQRRISSWTTCVWPHRPRGGKACIDSCTDRETVRPQGRREASHGQLPPEEMSGRVSGKDRYVEIGQKDLQTLQEAMRTRETNHKSLT
jgi:hypothetical protein